MAVLGEFLDDMAARGWQWGERDCLLWLGLWSERVTGIDGGSPWRGHYKTALGCARALKKSGGMAACIEIGTKLCGMIPVTDLKSGDIGIVRANTDKGVQEVGGIYTGERWAVLTDKGVLTGRVEPLMAWGMR